MAEVEVSFFQPDDIPDVELLKSALTELATSNKKNGDLDLCSFFTDISFRICRAQGKERDTYLLQCELQKYSNTIPLSKDRIDEAYHLLKRIYYIHAASNAQDKAKD